MCVCLAAVPARSFTATTTSRCVGRPLRCRRTIRMITIPDTALDRHIAIDPDFPGLRRINRSPDVYVVDGFLSSGECDSIREEASKREMTLSPVAFAGWTEDLKLLLRLLPVGVVPVMYNLLAGGMPKWEVAIIGLAFWAFLVGIFSTLATSLVEKRETELQSLRTSTSTTLPNAEGVGGRAIVAKAEELMRSSWRSFEAPTVMTSCTAADMKAKL